MPNLVEHAFPLLERDLFCSSSSSNPTFHGREIYLNVRETSVAKILNAFHEEFTSKGVALGSYPKFTHSYYKVSRRLWRVKCTSKQKQKTWTLHKVKDTKKSTNERNKPKREKNASSNLCLEVAFVSLWRCTVLYWLQKGWFFPNISNYNLIIHHQCSGENDKREGETSEEG